jgi:hypothetical protein
MLFLDGAAVSEIATITALSLRITRAAIWDTKISAECDPVTQHSFLRHEDSLDAREKGKGPAAGVKVNPVPALRNADK